MLIAGNWKMNTDVPEACSLAQGVVDGIAQRGEQLAGVGVAVCPPFVSLQAVAEVVDGTAVALGAQTMHSADEGAYTGEVSAPMLRSVACTYVILGHSERRTYFHETDAEVNAKVKQALDHDLVPIVCVGETKAQRDNQRAQEVVRAQVEGALEEVDIRDPSHLVIAYEPVWAIGTGDTATPLQAQEMHTFIRGVLEDRYGAEVSDSVPILYGGSMKPHNAASLLEQPDIDGGLIGGASLKAKSFVAIADAAAEVMGEKAAG